MTFLSEDFSELINATTRYINKSNTGRAKLNSFSMREEQKTCLARTVAFYQNPENIDREFLWNCKMRFGKTHVAYKLVMALDCKIVLILTGLPTDTKQAWIDAMDHVDFDFDEHNFIDASNNIVDQSQ